MAGAYDSEYLVNNYKSSSTDFISPRKKQLRICEAVWKNQEFNNRSSGFSSNSFTVFKKPTESFPSITRWS